MGANREIGEIGTGEKQMDGKMKIDSNSDSNSDSKNNNNNNNNSSSSSSSSNANKQQRQPFPTISKFLNLSRKRKVKKRKFLDTSIFLPEQIPPMVQSIQSIQFIQSAQSAKSTMKPVKKSSTSAMIDSINWSQSTSASELKHSPHLVDYLKMDIIEMSKLERLEEKQYLQDVDVAYLPQMGKGRRTLEGIEKFRHQHPRFAGMKMGDVHGRLQQISGQSGTEHTVLSKEENDITDEDIKCKFLNPNDFTGHGRLQYREMNGYRITPLEELQSKIGLRYVGRFRGVFFSLYTFNSLHTTSCRSSTDNNINSIGDNCDSGSGDNNNSISVGASIRIDCPSMKLAHSKCRHRDINFNPEISYNPGLLPLSSTAECDDSWLDDLKNQLVAEIMGE